MALSIKIPTFGKRSYMRPQPVGFVIRSGFFIPCMYGRYMTYNRWRCKDCQAGGFYQDEISLPSNDGCKRCKNGTFVSLKRAPGRSLADCWLCPRGTLTDFFAGYRACRCKGNYYRLDRFERCYPCLRYGVTCFNESLVLDPGYYWKWISESEKNYYINFTKNLQIFHENYDKSLVAFNGSLPMPYQCPRSLSCLGGMDSSCADAYTGALCAVCNKGYYKLVATCFKCPTLPWLIFQVCVICIVVMVILIVIIKVKKRRDGTKRSLSDVIIARVKIVVSFYQVSSGTLDAFSYVKWPSALIKLSEYAKFVQLNILQIAPFHCYNRRLKVDAYHNLVITCFLTFIVILTAFLYYRIKRWYLYRGNKSSSNTKLQFLLRETKEASYRNVFLFVFVTYPQTSTSIFQMLPPACHKICQDITQNKCSYYLKADYSVQCFTDKYNRYVILAYLASIYPIAVPLLTVVVLWNNRFKKKTNDEPNRDEQDDEQEKCKENEQVQNQCDVQEMELQNIQSNRNVVPENNKSIAAGTCYVEVHSEDHSFNQTDKSINKCHSVSQKADGELNDEIEGACNLEILNQDGDKQSVKGYHPVKNMASEEKESTAECNLKIPTGGHDEPSFEQRKEVSEEGQSESNMAPEVSELCHLLETHSEDHDKPSLEQRTEVSEEGQSESDMAPEVSDLCHLLESHSEDHDKPSFEERKEVSKDGQSESNMAPEVSELCHLLESHAEDHDKPSYGQPEENSFQLMSNMGLEGNKDNKEICHLEIISEDSNKQNLPQNVRKDRQQKPRKSSPKNKGKKSLFEGTQYEREGSERKSVGSYLSRMSLPKALKKPNQTMVKFCSSDKKTDCRRSGSMVANVPIVAAMSFIYENYHEDCWFWETIEMTRKLLLTSSLALIGADGRSSLGVACILSGVYAMLHAHYKPIPDRFEHILQMTSLLASFANTCIGMMLKIDTYALLNEDAKIIDSMITTVLLVTVNILVTGIVVVKYIVVVGRSIMSVYRNPRCSLSCCLSVMLTVDEIQSEARSIEGHSGVKMKKQLRPGNEFDQGLKIGDTVCDYGVVGLDIDDDASKSDDQVEEKKD